MDAHDMPRAVNICFLFNALFLPPSVVSGILWERVLERGSFTACSVMQTVSHYIPNRIELKDVNTCCICAWLSSYIYCYSNSSTCSQYK